jgi:hypothetical protein
LAVTALKHLVDLQRSLYDRAISEARENIGSGKASILNYQNEFESSLPSQFSISNVVKVLEAIDRSRIILFGDFHSHKQSQRAFLRILRMYQNRPDHAPVVVALEMFRSKDQAHINDWLEGRRTDHELLEAVSYDRTWGFPWSNFRPILDYCKMHGLKVVGLNTNNSGRDSLKKRDIHAAKILSKIAQTDPRARIFCLIGEFHLADAHLPQAMIDLEAQENQKFLRIFANLDKYFFALKPDKLQFKDEYLLLNKNTFCIINSPPWIKWHSYSLWEEMRRLGNVRHLEDHATNMIEIGDSTYDDSDYDDHYTDEVLDLDYHLRHLQKKLCEFFKVDESKTDIEHFTVSHDNLDSSLEHMHPSARDAFLTRISLDGFGVEYQQQLVYMPEVTINNMAAAAGQMLFGSMSRIHENYSDPDQLFAVQCLKYTFGWISNKILNPRIPLYDRKSLETYLAQVKGKRLIGLARQRRHLAKATFDAQLWISKNWMPEKLHRNRLARLPNKHLALDTSTSNELARSLAQVIAEPVCRGLVKGKIDISDIKKWLVQDWQSDATVKLTLASMIMLSE